MNRRLEARVRAQSKAQSATGNFEELGDE